MDKQDVDQDLQLNDRDEALMEDVARLGIDQNDDHDREDKAVDNAEEDSTYPEVESAVANVDDYYMPCGTFRSWVIGLLWAVLIPGLNQFFFYRYPSVQIGSLVALLLSFPLGRGCAALLPDWKLGGLSLNPGPFSIKEHTLITIMANVGAGSAYASDIVAVQRVYYNQAWNFAYQWLIVMATQIIGFSMGGFLQRFIVSPPSMIWPANLVYCSLFNTLHQSHLASADARGGISRGRFFAYACAFSFTWYFIPGYLFEALSYFSWACWIAPDNVVVNQLFGVLHGLGGSLLSFDWSQTAYNGSPLATPWWAEANVIGGFFIFYWILAPALYYTNTWYSAYLPISSRNAYDNTGAHYNVTRILNPDATFNSEAYHAYSPIFLSTAFAMAVAASFASVPATVIHALLYFRKDIWDQFPGSRSKPTDIHAKLMSRYQQVPWYWYGITFIIMITFAIVSLEVWHTDFPVYVFVIGLTMAFIVTIPIGIIQAVSNQQVSLNVVSETIVGYWVPGKPLTTMLFKAYVFITTAQALTFASDLKLGHYMKVPPRTLFWGQISATVIAGTVQLGVQAWMFTNIPDMCTSTQPSGFTCPTTQVAGTTSIVWGVIGPSRQFSAGSTYYALAYFFLIGALSPVIFYLLGKRYPSSLFKDVNLPVVFTGASYMFPATPLNYIPWAIVGFIFQFMIRRHHTSWWIKYNYILSAAMDSGVALSGVFIFFVLQYPRNGTIGLHSIQTWWGNTVPFKTADARGTPLRDVPAMGHFGPNEW